MNEIKSLSKIERLMLINQFKILKKLNDDCTDYDDDIKALEYGYVSHYSWMTQNICDEVPEELCKLVLDVLSLHEKLHFSYEKLTDKDGIDADSIKFRGFDGNNETEYMGYAQYFCHQLQRYTILFKSNFDFNSHFPSLDRYKAMLAVAQNLPKSEYFSAEQIKAIIKNR